MRIKQTDLKRSVTKKRHRPFVTCCYHNIIYTPLTGIIIRKYIKEREYKLTEHRAMSEAKVQARIAAEQLVAR